MVSTLVATLVVVPAVPAGAVANAVTVTAAPGTVAPGNTLDLVAAMPVSATGTISQEIIVQIDPAKVKLTSATDIKAPAGWTVTYCATVCNAPPTNFTATAPADALQWAAVKAVRAVGSVDSQGEYQGRQLASRTASIGVPATGPFVATGSGDGWSVFFDDRGYVFNIFHHTSSNVDNVNCRRRDGSSCGSNWPYGSGTGNGQTSNVSNGWYDPVHQHLWYDATRRYDVGFECVDVSDIANPRPCGGSLGSTFVAAGISKSPISGTPNFGSFNSAETRGIAAVGGRIFSQTDGGATPKIICVDTQANGGLGARCPGSPFDPTPGQSSAYIGAVMISGGKLWVTSSNTAPRGGMSCFDPFTLQVCSPAWPKTWPMGAPAQLYHLVEIPSASGGVIGVCATTSDCYSPTGSGITLPSGLATWYDGVGDPVKLGEHALRQGSRLYRGNGNGAAAGTKTISCWDQAINAGAGGVCANWPITAANYAIALDPLNDNCIWKNDHVNAIKAYDAVTATENCLTPPSRVVIPAEAAVPRMACATTASGVREWRSLKLLAPSASGYTSASLTILDSAGQEIPGWVDVAFDDTNNRVINLASLAVATTGQNPTFVVEYAGLTSATNTSVELVAVGDSPELCLRPQAVSSCPVVTGPGPQPDSPANGSFVVLGDGSATTGSGTTPYTQGSATVTVGAGPSLACAAALLGTALTNDGDALPVAGATVALLDSSDTPLTYPGGHPQAGQEITAVTDAQGGYSFPMLAAGTYKVKFVNTSTHTVQNSRMIASSAGPAATTAWVRASGSGAARAVVSPATSITNAGTGVVNGYFSPGPTARPNTSAGGQGLAQSISPLVDDSPSTGAAWPASGTPVTLCAPGESPPCMRSTATAVPGEGYYLPSTSGTVTFQPCKASNDPSSSTYPGLNCAGPFTGTATPMSYTATDSAGGSASSTLTPTVVPAPVAAANVGTGAWDQVQSFTPFADDTPGSVGGTSYPFSASSVKICATSTVDASCTATTSIVVANQGTWSMNPVTGVVSFDPLPAFTGTATPIKYCVSDSVNQRVCSTITPTVTAPPSPSATPEAKSVAAGASVAFTSVTGAGGLGTSGGPPLITTNTSSGTGLCPVGTVLPGQVANCTLTSVAVSGQGTYTLNRTTGVVTYAAVGGASSGSKTPVSYVIRDGVTSGGRTDWASGVLTPFIPGPPVAADDTASANWDVTQSVNVLGNDSVDAGQSLVASSVRLCGAGDVSPACDDTLVTTAQGTYTVDLATGAVSFDPLPTFWGTATPITYTVTDSQGLKDPATLTVTVAAPGLPVAADDTVLVSPGGSVAFDALIGAGGLSSSGGPALASACLWVSGACDGDGVVVVNSGGGVYVLDAATKVATFHACTGVGVPHVSCTQALSGQPESVSYRVTDAVSQADTGVLTARVPVAPVSRDDSAMAEAGATQVITPLGNDQAGDAALDVASLKLCGLSPNAQTPPNCTQTSITTAAGVYTVSGGSVTFVPTDDSPGTDVDVTYQIADAFGQTSSAVIRVTELPKPAPRPAPDALSGPYGQSLTFTPMTNDTFGTVPADDSTNNVLTQVQNTGWRTEGSLKLCGAGQAPPGCDKTSVATADGTYVVTGTDVVFTGNASFTGVATQPVMYQVANTYDVVVTDYNDSGTPSSTNFSKIGSSTMTPTITVAPVSVTPDAASTPWNTPVTDNVLVDDTSGAAINAGDLKLCGPNDAGVCAQTTVTVVGKGTYDVVAGGVRFTPLPGFSGPADPITYRTTDALGRPISSTFTPTVGAPNGPTALSESKPVLAGGSVSFTTLAESGPLVAPGVNAAGINAVLDGSTCLLTPGTSVCDADGIVTTADGTYVLNGLTGVVSYTANANAPSGPQVPVTYRVVDALGLTANATLTPTVYARPVVQAKARTDVINLDQVFTVLADDTHDPATTILASSVRLCGADDTAPDCTQLTRTLTGIGVFTVDPATGAITFNPDDTYVGAVPAVAYSADDTLGQRTSATLTPTIVALPRPAAVNDSGTAASGSTVTFTPWSNDDTIDAPRGASVTTATLVPTSILLCGPGDVALPGGAGCDDTTVTTVDGTYVLDPSTGTVVFTHAPGFTGTATAPVSYQVTTEYSINAGPTQAGYASALLTPIITASGGGGGGGGGGSGGGVPSPSPSPSPSPGPDPVTEPDAGVGRPGDPVRVDPIGNDSPGAGQAFDEGTLRLCPDGTAPPGCTGLVVQTDQGTWVVDPFTGAVTFTPVPGFEGLVEMPYVVETEAGEVVDSVISIWITDPPAAADDASSGQVDTPQTLDPWGNDTHDAAPWDRGSLALCGAGQSPPGCDQTRVQTPDGVYEVDPVTGKVIFTPAQGFTGTATPLQYQVADEAGQVASAWLRPSVRGGTGEADAGWLQVRKVITGNDLRTGIVRIVTICTDGSESMRKVHRLGVDRDRGVWRVQVPAGMRCTVEETAHGAPKAAGLAPMWEDRRWAVDHAPTVAVGASIAIGTAVPIDRLILKAQGSCEIQAGVLRAITAGTCIVTWRAPDGDITTSTRWTHVGPRGTRVKDGTLTRGFVIRDGAETKVTFHNRYRTQDQTVTRTVYVTPQCPTTTPKQATWTAPWAPPQAMAAYAPRGGPSDPGTCSPA